MKKHLFLVAAFLFLISFGEARAQSGWLSLQPRYFSAGISYGLPAGVNVTTAVHFSNYALRLSGLYSGSNDGAPNGAELSFFIRLYQGRQVTHSIFHMAGLGQSGSGVSNLQTYMGYGYQIKWKGLFAQIRLPIFYTNNGGYTGSYNYFKVGYIHDFR